LAAATVARCARVVVESKAQSLGGLVAGTATLRQADDQVMSFDAVGFALEDTAIVALACTRLVEL
jgi:ornithine cyclodeaminase/alanine dehydrogenase-like protein (mu-crystallin family)